MLPVWTLTCFYNTKHLSTFIAEEWKWLSPNATHFAAQRWQNQCNKQVTDKRMSQSLHLCTLHFFIWFFCRCKWSLQQRTAFIKVVTSGECLRGEGLVWLIGAVVCFLAATAGPMSISAGSGWPHLRCSTTGSCQSTATSEIVKARCSW